MPHYLVSGILPDNFDPSTQDEATVHAINVLNDELEAAGARLVAAGLSAASQAKSLGSAQWRSAHHRRPVSGSQGARWWFYDTGSRRHGRGAGVGPQGCHRLPDAGRVARDPIQQPAERHTSPIAPAKAVSTPRAKPAPPPTSTTVSATTPGGRAKCPRRFVEFQCCRSLTK